MLLLSYCPSKLKEKMLSYLDANRCPAVQDAKDYKMLTAKTYPSFLSPQ